MLADRRGLGQEKMMPECTDEDARASALQDDGAGDDRQYLLFALHVHSKGRR